MEDNSPKKRTREKSQKGWLVVAGLVLILVVVTVVLVFLLRGETKVTGDGERLKITETVTCENDQIEYPIFKYDNASSRSLKIITTFTDDKLDGVSLVYRLNYGDSVSVEKSDAENQAAMNFSFGDDGFGPNAFDAKYSNVDNSFQMTLYAKAEDLTGNATKYFMLDNLGNKRAYTQDSVIKAYNKRGLNCVYKEIMDKEANEK